MEQWKTGMLRASLRVVSLQSKQSLFTVLATKPFMDKPRGIVRPRFLPKQQCGLLVAIVWVIMTLPDRGLQLSLVPRRVPCAGVNVFGIASPMS